MKNLMGTLEFYISTKIELNRASKLKKKVSKMEIVGKPKYIKKYILH